MGLHCNSKILKLEYNFYESLQKHADVSKANSHPFIYIWLGSKQYGHEFTYKHN